MTPKEKAEELIDKFKPHSISQRIWMTSDGEFYDDYTNAKECAKIAVEQLRFFHKALFYTTKGSIFDQYLDDVKKEIEKI